MRSGQIVENAYLLWYCIAWQYMALSMYNVVSMRISPVHDVMHNAVVDKLTTALG